MRKGSVFRLLWSRLIYLQGSLHRYFGNRSGFRREHENAVRCFGRAYALDPMLRVARLDRGILYWREMGQVEEALADFDALLAEDPEYAAAMFNRALALQAMGRYSEALSSLEMYLKMPALNDSYRRHATRLVQTLQDLLAPQP